MERHILKGIRLFSLCIFCMVIFTACNGEKDTLDSAIAEEEKSYTETADNTIRNERREMIHENIPGDSITKVIINGNARSVVVEQGVNDYFEFYNADLNDQNKYEVNCDEDGDILNINIMMQNPDSSNNILGSIVLAIPQKEFEKVESIGTFRQIHFDTLNSDVFVSANSPIVGLNLEADQLEHNITLDGSESDIFQNVSVYLDKLPDNIKLDFTTIEGGRLSAPENLLKDNKLELGTGKPSVSIRDTDTIDFYIVE